MPVITISREYGSGAVEVAQRVSEMLGYAYFDKKLMAQVALEVGLAAGEVVDFSEDDYKVRNFLDRMFDRRRSSVEVLDTDWGVPPVKVEALDEAHSVKLVKDTLLAAYQHDNVVIVGRGGQVVLKEKPGVLHVRLTAPQGARALRVKDRENLTLGEATDLVLHKDQAAAAYLKRFYEVEWDNPLLYHLLFNTGKWELEAVAQIIVNALTHLKMVSSE